MYILRLQYTLYMNGQEWTAIQQSAGIIQYSQVSIMVIGGIFQKNNHYQEITTTTKGEYLIFWVGEQAHAVGRP